MKRIETRDLHSWLFRRHRDQLRGSFRRLLRRLVSLRDSSSRDAARPSWYTCTDYYYFTSTSRRQSKSSNPARRRRAIKMSLWIRIDMTEYQGRRITKATKIRSALTVHFPEFHEYSHMCSPLPTNRNSIFFLRLPLFYYFVVDNTTLVRSY